MKNNKEKHAVTEMLKQFVKLIASNYKKNDRKYNSMYEFVLAEGERFEAANFEDVADQYPGTCRTKKECFRNAHVLATCYNLTYVEGYASSFGLPMEHAWCVIPGSDKVIDPTWDYDPENTYLGIRFNTKYVNKIILKREMYGVIDNWEQKWPLLQHGVTNYKVEEQV